jgi:type IV pilus assembly protein PilM
MPQRLIQSLFTNRRRQALPIGIDLGADGVRLLQLEVVGDSVSVVGAAREAWPDEVRERLGGQLHPPTPAEAKHVLDRLHRQGLLSGRRVAIALPRDCVQVKSVRLPVMPADETEQAARLEAQQAFGIDPSAHETRVIPLGEVKQGGDIRQEVLLLAAKRSDVETIVEQWHDIGFAPDTIDFEAAALYRAVERFVRRKDDEAEVNVIVDMGHRRTNVVIGRGRDMNFFKPIDIGGHQLNEAVSRALGVSVDEARTIRTRLIETTDTVSAVGEDPVRQAVYDTLRPSVEQLGREIGLCLRYFSVNFRGRRPARVRIVSGESRDPAVIQILAGALPVPVEAGKPVANADLSRMKAVDRTSGLGDWTIAFGLSLKQCRGSFPDRLGASRSEQVGSSFEIDSTKSIDITPGTPEELIHA